MDEQPKEGIDSTLFRRMLAIMAPLMVGFLLEKRLGRPLTVWDWQVYYEEMENRRQWVTWWAARINNLIQLCDQIAQIDRRITDRETMLRLSWCGF